jgi:DNA polymerase-4
MERKIIHIDMDAFFVAVEQRDNPSLRGKPVVVGSPRKRGVIAAASYEARKYGIFSAMPSIVAARKCKDLIFVPGRFHAYKEASEQIMQVFYEYTDQVEPLSLDEAYLDVTTNKMDNPSATNIAKEIKIRIKESTELTASAGVSFNKFLAKVGSDFNKPDGLCVITPALATKFIEALKIEKFPGVGKVTAGKLHELGISTGKDLKKLSQSSLINQFGKFGEYLFNMSHGIDNREVIAERIRKSIGAERTFGEDIHDEAKLLESLHRIAEILDKRIKKSNSSGKTLTLKIKYFDFEITTRSKTVFYPISDISEVLTLAQELFYTPKAPYKRVRLLGLSLSNLDNHEINIGDQLKLNFQEIHQ